MDRAKFKTELDQISYQLEELLYIVGDASKPATEDQIMNYLIGMIEGVKAKRDKLMSTGPTVEECGLPPYSERVRDVTQPPWSAKTQ